MYSDIIAIVKINNSCENEKKYSYIPPNIYDISNYQVILGYNKIEIAAPILKYIPSVML